MSTLSPLHVASLSPASVSALAWSIGGARRITLILKATFHLVHEAPMELVRPLPIVTEERLDEASGSLLDASDMAPGLPGIDVFARGHACVSGPRQVRAMSVRLALFRDRWLLDKRLNVYGDRGAGEPTARPFSRLPIVYERAYGGPGVEDNPVGVGSAPGDRRLPNVVAADQPRRPAGFGPIARNWPSRRRLVPREPSFDDGWLALPDGFPPAYFHAAPADQRLARLHGDEWLVVEGMHPAIPCLSTRLPLVRAAAMRYRTDGLREPPRPVEMTADTLAVDMDNLLCWVVFRGSFALLPGESASSFRAFTGLDLPGLPIEWPDFEDLVRPASMGQGGGAPPGTISEPRGASSSAPDMTIGFGFEQQNALAGRPIAPFALAAPRAGIPPMAPTIPGAPWTLADSRTARLEAATQDQIRSLAKLFEQAPGPPQEECATLFPLPDAGSGSAARPLAPFALAEPGSTLPRKHPTIPGAPWSAPEPPPSSADRNLGAGAPGGESGVDITLPPLGGLAEPASPRIDAARGERFPATAMAPAGATKPPEAPASDGPSVVLASRFEIASSRKADVRRDVLTRLASRESLRALDLEGADLHGIDLRGANLRGLKLQRANLAGARLESADLEGASLREADLSGADLTRANLARADMERARLSNAVLNDAVLTDARGACAIFDDAAAQRVSFTRGDWRGASFHGADLTSSNFSSASLSDARLSGARLTGASFEDASGRAAVFDGASLEDIDATRAELVGCSFCDVKAARSRWANADLRESKLCGAVLTGGNLERANLTGADLSGAQLDRASLQRAIGEGANFSRACLDGSDLRSARLAEASFERASLRDATAAKADLTGARLRGATLSGAQLRAAKLRQADISRVSLEGADLRDADMERANLQDTDRSGAKLAGANLRDAIE